VKFIEKRPADWSRLCSPLYGRSGNWTEASEYIKCRADADGADVYAFLVDGDEIAVLAHNIEDAMQVVNKEILSEVEAMIEDALKEIRSLDLKVEEIDDEIASLEEDISELKRKKQAIENTQLKQVAEPQDPNQLHLL